MKKLLTFVFGLSVVVFLSGMDLYAQRGRGGGQGQGPAVSQGRGNPGSQANRGPGENQGRGKAAEKREDRTDPREDRADKRTEPRNKAAEHIERNPELSERVQSLLPAGANLRTAASGFKNQGQFIAALHVSKNLNIPFNDLKAKMTGSNSMPLGKAIQELRPDMDAEKTKAEVKKAEQEAKKTEDEAKAEAKGKAKRIT